MDPGTFSTAKNTKPVPVPRALPAAVHYTARAGCATLQEQMRLEHDGVTFAEIVKLIRRTAARHIDLELRYMRQDPQRLEKIRQEVLKKCPLLGEIYVDAWPITWYLRISLKYHHCPVAGPQRGRQHTHGSPKKSAMYVLIPREYVAPTSRQGTQKNHDTVKEASGKAAGFHAPTTSTRRATGCSRSASEEAVRDILGLSDDGCESGKNSASPSPSSSSGDAHPKTYQAGAEAASFSDTEDSLQDNQDQKGGIEHHSELISYCIPDQERSTSTVPTESRRPRATHTTRPTADTAGKDRSHARLPSAHSFAIRDMFIARGLLVTDAQRIALLLSTLGVVDKAGLRVFSRLTFCETWISEMRQKERLSEIEAGVIRDVLDTVRTAE